MFVISLFVPLKMASAEAEGTWKKYGAFLNSLHPEIERLIRRPDGIHSKIGRNEVTFLFNIYIYIYIYIYRDTGSCLRRLHQDYFFWI